MLCTLTFSFLFIQISSHGKISSCYKMLTGGEGDGGIQEKKKYILVSEEEFNVVLRALDEIAEQRDNLRNECSIQKKQLQQLLYV